MTEFDPVLVHGWLERAAQKHPDKTAIVCGKEGLTYRALNDRASRLARGLIDLGLERGDRVVIFLENGLEAVIAIYAILKAGGVFVPVEALTTSAGLSHILHDSGARLVITHVEKAPVVSAADFDQERLACVWIGPQELIPPQSGQAVPWSTYERNEPPPGLWPRIIDIDLAALIYTSGSTGRPKGIVCTHQNMVSAARSIIQYIGNTEDDIILDALPLSFDYGLYQVLMSVMFGGRIVLERSVGFLEPLLQTIEKERVTGLPVVPSITAMLLRLKQFPSSRLSSLRYITNTGALWPETHIRTLRRLLPNVRIFSMYGLTECKRVAFLPPELIDTAPGSVGGPIPNCETMLLHESGRSAGPGETGELVVRGSNVMQGYWNDPEASGAVFRAGRYPAERLLHTGDWFRMGEDGLLYFVGRRDDIIKCSGRRVSLKEIVMAVAAVDGVVEAAAVGVPDEVSGKVIAVFYTTKPDQGPSEPEVRSFCEKTLEPYKVPKFVRRMDALPKTPNGKTDNKKLEEMAGSQPGKISGRNG